jgi:hypothetical protein
MWYTAGGPEEGEEDDPEIVDVTDALQLLVNNSYVEERGGRGEEERREGGEGGEGGEYEIVNVTDALQLLVF